MRLRLIAYLLFVCFLALGQGDSIKPVVEITNWPEGKKCAVVLSFDDWSPGHGKIVYPLLKKYGMVGTFFLTIKDTVHGGGWEVIEQAYKDGNEIANHTQSHAFLDQLDSIQLEYEISKTKEIIEKKLGESSCNTIAYPYGLTVPKATNIAQRGHIAGRIASAPYNRKFPYVLTPPSTNYFEIPTIAVNEFIAPNTVKTLTGLAVDDGGLLVLMYHSVYNDSINDKWFQPIHESLFEAHLKVVESKKRECWITTFEKAIKYHKLKADTRLEIVRKGKIDFVKVHTPSNKQLYNKVSLTLKLSVTKPIKKIKTGSGVVLKTKLLNTRWHKELNKKKEANKTRQKTYTYLVSVPVSTEHLEIHY